MNSKNFYITLLAALFIVACNPKTETEVKLVTLEQIDTAPEPPPPPPPSLPSVSSSDVSVKAHLIYNDGSISSFDVLNDKSIALWNTTIGAGDAEKPSDKLSIVVSGKPGNLHLNIRKGDKPVVNKDIKLSKSPHKFIIEDTGCETVEVEVLKNDKVIFYNIVPFMCGE